MPNGSRSKNYAGDGVEDCTEIELSAEIMKNDEPVRIPLVGPLAEIATMLKERRKSFPKTPSSTSATLESCGTQLVTVSASASTTKSYATTVGSSRTISAVRRHEISIRLESLDALPC